MEDGEKGWVPASHVELCPVETAPSLHHSPLAKLELQLAALHGLGASLDQGLPNHVRNGGKRHGMVDTGAGGRASGVHSDTNESVVCGTGLEGCVVQ